MGIKNFFEGLVMKPVKALPAATIILVRDKDDRFELFMQQRPSSAKFGGVYVFPGGKVTGTDSLLKENYRISGLTPEEADARLNVASNGLDYWIAAVRECFEEAGILLAYTEEGHDVVDFSEKTLADRFQLYRQQLNAKELEFHQLCLKERLTLALDRIHPYDHWITPEYSSYRFDTRFFIARAPKYQKGYHDNHETVDSVWLTPQEAMQRYAKGTLPMILPTIDTIESLMRFKNLDDILSHIAGKSPGTPKSV